MSDDLPTTIAEAADRLAAKALSPVELTRALLARIEQLNPTLAAFVTVTADRALADAAAAEAALLRGDAPSPLTGIPIALKDIYDTAGIRTTSHSRLHLDRVPTTDACSVAKLRAAGTVLLGKLATYEFAFGGPSDDLPFPIARNPWNPAHVTGGSSSGSGAALAAGLVLGATGSDTGGSIRTPAHNCGITGLKPTYGLVSRRGIMPLAYSLDHAGPMARTAEDCALLLQAMAGHDPDDPASAAVPIPDYRAALGGGIEGMRIGLIRHFYDGDEDGGDAQASPAMKAAIERAVGVFTELGAVVEEVRLSPLATYYACCMTIMLTEALAVHAKDLRERPERYGRMLRERVTLAALIDGVDYVQAMRLRTKLMAETRRLYGRYDALLTASAWGVAPKVDEVTTWFMFDRPLLTSPFNVTGDPSVCLPCGFSDGLPMGFQLAAAPFADATALKLAHAYQQATDWHERRPWRTS